jgi:hypothetical protein
VVTVEPHVGGAEILERPREQPCARDQQDRQRDLDGREHFT